MLNQRRITVRKKLSERRIEGIGGFYVHIQGNLEDFVRVSLMKLNLGEPLLSSA